MQSVNTGFSRGCDINGKAATCNLSKTVALLDMIIVSLLLLLTIAAVAAVFHVKGTKSPQEIF